jgi:hypothetical protein
MERLNFETAFKYPFNRATGMWNILWVLLPIFGWFALGGYGVRIIQEFVKGEFKQLPMMDFGNDLKLGFFMFLRAFPFFVVYAIVGSILEKTGSATQGLVNFFLGFFIIPMLAVNFIKKETMAAFFEFGVLKAVFDNFSDYVVAMLKSILLTLIFIVMWIVLVGIPAGAFTENIFIADFYRRRVK